MRNSTYFIKVSLLCAFLVCSIVTPVLAQTNITLKASTKRSIGGVGTLDRAQYFNHWGQITPGTNTNLGDLQSEVHDPAGLHTFSGRETNDFPAAMQLTFGNGLPEDPNKPGFFERTALVNNLQNNTNTWGYKYRVLQSDRFVSLRESENPIYVTSGRKDSPDTPTQTNLYPDFLTGGGPFITNYAGFADFLNVYLEEVVYGTGPGQGYLPFDKNRFYVEIMNEPNWPANGTAGWQQVVEMHREITQRVKEVHPQAKLGGPSCCDGLNENPNNNWDRAKALIDDMASWETPSGHNVELDFYTIHPYERYNVLSNGSWERQVFTSPGHVEAIMDLYDTYSTITLGQTKPFAITEYGSFNQTAIKNGPGTADDDYGNYTRAEQQWDLVRDTREKLMVFMNRPDRIVNATPFLGPRWWENQIPSSPAGHPAFWDRDAQGDWHETIVAGMYRMHNDIRGEYLDIESDNPDVQTLAFRDGDILYVMLNNLENSNTTLNLQAITGNASVLSASLDRVYWNGTQGVYEEGLDRTATWQNLTLLADEGAVLKLLLDGSMLNDLVTNVQTYYGDGTLSAIGSSGLSSVFNILAETEDAVSAKMRVAFHRNGAALGEGFEVFVNGTSLAVPAGELEYDDSDTDMISRYVDVPLGLLVDGNNEVYVDFLGSGGELITAVLEVTKSIGDYNGSGAFDGEDLSLLFDELGPATAGSKFDLIADGTVDFFDIFHWAEELRGIDFQFGDFDLDGDIDSDDLAIQQSGYGSGTHIGQGDMDLDDDVDGRDFLSLQLALSAANGAATALASQVPEPSAALILLMSCLAWPSRSSRRL